MTYVTSNYCSGCGACVSVCPVGALSFGSDEDGFYVPVADKSLCEHCGKCMKTCPMLHPKFINKVEPKCYAVKADDATRFLSSSGGVFSVMSNFFLENGGRVCGAAWADDLTVKHIIVDNMEGLSKLRKSKYIQSFTGNIYREIENILKDGKPFLFSGCPCQVAGLYAALDGGGGQKYKNLYTVDLLCGGANSTLHFHRYLDETFGLDNVISCEFKSKVRGWNCETTIITTKDKGKIITSRSNNPSVDLQLSRTLRRKVCVDCVFCRYPRQGDFTLGDFWKLENDKLLGDTKGISCFIVNNNRGENIVKFIKDNVSLMKEFPFSFILNGNGDRTRAKYKVDFYRDRFFHLIKKYRSFKKASEYVLSKKWDVGFVCQTNPADYGKAISNWALYKTLLGNGYETLIIENKKGQREKKILDKKNNLEMFRSFPYEISDMFFHNTKSEMAKTNSMCDVFLVSSDNNLIYQNYDLLKWDGDSVLLDFVGDNKKKSAYGVSFVDDICSFDENQRALSQYFVNRFDFFSVGEKPDAEISKQYFGLEPILVLDPVFLCDKSYFDEIAQKGMSEKSDGIMSYIINGNEESEKIKNSLSDILKMDVNVFADKNKGNALYYCEDWLYALSKSSFVITDSFYGACFAIIYKKPFVFIKTGKNRGISFLEMLGLKNRVISNLSDISRIQNELFEVRYDGVYEILNKEKEKSSAYLKKIVSLNKSEKLKPLSGYDVIMDQIVKGRTWSATIERRRKEQEVETKMILHFLLNKKSFYFKYYRYKVMSKIMFGAKKKYYVAKYGKYSEYVNKIHSLINVANEVILK